jgi:transmembrane sensor
MSTYTEEIQLSRAMQEAIEWLVKLRGDNLSEVETHAFADWLSKDFHHTEAFAKAEDLFDDMVAATQLPQSPVLSQKIAEPKPSQPNRSLPKPVNWRWLCLPLALAAAWLFAIGLVLPSQTSLLDTYLSDYHTGAGEFKEINLADGSHLLLNTNTAISVDYRPDKRHLTLHHGQVRFTVAKDARRPFEVDADGLTVRALGTVFEIYRQASGTIKVTVQEHAVAARLDDESQSAAKGKPAEIEVKAGQQLIFGQDGTLQQPTEVNLAQATAWQQRRLFINDRPLSELIAELDRYRSGRIFLSSQLNNLRVTGVFTLDNPDLALSRVQKVLGFQSTRLGAWWVLLHR